MVPLKELLLKYKNSKFDQACGIHDGSFPVNWLKATTKVFIPVSSPKSEGIVPAKEFSMDSKYSKDVSLDNSLGIAPATLLLTTGFNELEYHTACRLVRWS